MSDIVPLRCLCCGNAVLSPRHEHEAGAAEIVMSLCPICDNGGFEEAFYVDRNGRMMTYIQWMESRGLEP